MNATPLRRILGNLHYATVCCQTIARWRASSRATLLLRYHALGEPEAVSSYASPGISLGPARFEEHVRLLMRRFDVIDLGETIRRASEGRGPRNRPCVVITFDDGYLDNFTTGLPILSRHGAPATFYVTAGAVAPAPPIWTVRLRHILATAGPSHGPNPLSVQVDLSNAAATAATNRQLTRSLRAMSAADREEALVRLAQWLRAEAAPDRRVMMSREELRAMVEAGMTIGAHTVTHPMLPLLPRDEADFELRRSRELLQDICGAAVDHLSYPNPGGGEQHDAEVRAMASKIGYRSGSTSESGIFSGHTDLFAIPRMGITPGRQERILFRFLAIA